MLAVLHGMWDLSSQTRDQTRTPLLWKHVVLPTGLPGNPLKNILEAVLTMRKIQYHMK